MKFSGKLKLGAQKVGRSLSGMVMPNIGAFLAWGLLTALFLTPGGWFPNTGLDVLLEPMIYYLLPLLVAFTAGKMIAKERGGLIATIGCMGVIIGSDIPMFLGVMIFAPICAISIKYFDKLVHGKIKAGFEMLVNNFSIGIIGMGLAIIGYFLIGPFITMLSSVLAFGAETLFNAGLLPLLSIFVEPAKVLFLNNAINHGILSPIAIQQVLESGKSILFLVEANPGPGLGILLAYSIFAKGSQRSNAQGATVIHFFGGIHEIYFPFVLMNPILILAAIAGGATGIAVFSIFNVGLIAAAAPGSIISLLLLCPASDIVFLLLGVALSTLVSFLVASVFVKIKARKGNGDEELEQAKEKLASEKAKAKGTAVASAIKKIETKIVFACDAGMGSSAMGATMLKKKFKDAGIEISIPHYAISDIPEDVELVVTQNELAPRAKTRVPNAEIYPVNNFMSKDAYDILVKRFTEPKEEKLDEKLEEKDATKSDNETVTE